MNNHPVPVEVEALRYAHEHLRELRQEAARQRLAATGSRSRGTIAGPGAWISSIRAAIGVMDRSFDPAR
jgi:hypothetical protein